MDENRALTLRLCAWVRSLARRWALRWRLDAEDLESEGLVGLAVALSRADPSRAGTLELYAKAKAAFAMKEWRRKQYRRRRILAQCALAYDPASRGPSPELDLELKEAEAQAVPAVKPDPGRKPRGYGACASCSKERPIRRDGLCFSCWEPSGGWKSARAKS